MNHFTLAMLLGALGAVLVAAGWGWWRAPGPPLPVSLERGVYRVMPDGESVVTVAVTADGITHMAVDTWLDVGCEKTFILAVRGIDRLRCTAVLFRDAPVRYLPRHRYRASTSCGTYLEELAQSREDIMALTDVWVEPHCEEHDGAGRSDSEAYEQRGVARRPHHQRARVLVSPTDDSTGRADRAGGV